jgi:signal transduction histidine kinase
MAEANFSIIDEINSVKTVLGTDLKKMHSKFSFNIDASVPQKVRASRSSFRQILWNLISS